MPRGAAIRGNVINAVGDCQLPLRVHRRTREVGKRFHPGRRADLVGDDAQFLALSGEPQHRQKKILSSCRVHPAGAIHQKVVRNLADRLFTHEFCLAVDILRRSWTVLKIRLCCVAGKNVVRRIVNYCRTEAIGLFGKNTRCLAVDLHGEFGLLFRPIHCGVGPRVQNQRRLYFAATAADGFGVSQIQPVAVKRMYLGVLSE